MDMNKYAMLKAIVPQKEYISVSMLKSELKVTAGEAQEMMRNLTQEGMIEGYSSDGVHFKVRK